MDPASFNQTLAQLRESQFFSGDRLWQLQRRALSAICQHAAHNVPFYAQAFSEPRIDRSGAIDPEWFRSRPLLRRRDLQDSQDALTSRARQLEPSPPVPFDTGGSSGSPVRVLWSRHANALQQAFIVRQYEWMGLDPADTFCSVFGHNVNQQPARQLPWYPGSGGPPALNKGFLTPIPELLEWLCRKQPVVLKAMPSIVRELAALARETETRIDGLRHVLTNGETVREGLDELVQDAWGAKLSDRYSSREVGVMALTCPDGSGLHVQSETVFLEVLREDGAQAAEGEVGAVIVTGLHNTAMPLIRYDIGDLAEVGPECTCGRGLPTLRRIMGRQRDMLIGPDGEKVVTYFNVNDITQRAPVRRYQIRQKSPVLVHYLYVNDEDLSTDQQDVLRDYLSERLPDGIRVEIYRVDDLPQLGNGKFQDVVIEMAS